MPTNILRNRPKTRAEELPKSGAIRRVSIKAGRVSLRAELLDTPTAARIWASLPLFSTAETWGLSIHFETPVETGRERTARVLASPNDIYFWSDENRVLIAFGRTPISRPGEIRLPRPCNVWAAALDDVAALSVVTPGEKVSMSAVAESQPLLEEI